MDYFFNGSEIFINEVTFLNKTICNNYNYFNFIPIPINEINNKNQINNKIDFAGRLTIEEAEKNQVISFTFNIFSENQTNVVLFFDTSPAIKLWLNNEIILSKNDYVNSIFCRTLKKGKNVFYGEFFTPTPIVSHFACRVSSYDIEKNRKYDNILDSKSSLVNSPSVDFFATDEASYIEKKEYIDCIFPRDIFKLNIDDDIILDIFPGNSDEAIDSLLLRYNKKYILNLDKYRQKLSPDTYYIVLKYRFSEYGVNVQTSYRMIIIRDFIDKTINMISKEKETDILWENVYENVGNLKNNPQQFYSYYLKLIKTYNISPYDEKNLHGGNIAEINVDIGYFQSQLDGKIKRYFIRKPTGYNKNKKYPLFLFISINDSLSYYSYLITNDNYFIADVEGRGVTGGSCIGEVSILEALSLIKQNYNIDDKKIYLVGYSNGGYAAVNLILRHPDMFAGTFTMSALCDKSLLCNIQDKKCINLYSTFDTLNNKKCFYDKSDINALTDIECPILNHRLLSHYFAQEKALSELLKVSTEPIPKHIHAKTYSLIHKKYYWFEFLDISFGFKFAEADIMINKDNAIKININNCNRFKVHNPFEEKDQIIVFDINGHRINTTFPKSGYLIFEKSDDNFHISKEKEKQLSLKGTGLLTVYYDSLNIYVTDKDPILEKTATNFSSPSTNGYNRQINIEYPVKDISNFDFKKNAILIDDLNDNNLTNSIRSNLFVKLYKKGFEYKNKKHNGDYCILQIIYSPFNKNKTILHVGFNNKELLHKNFFLRKVILSFDFNGLNPHWNNEALILYKNNYYTIYENNAELKAYLNNEK